MRHTQRPLGLSSRFAVALAALTIGLTATAGVASAADTVDPTVDPTVDAGVDTTKDASGALAEQTKLPTAGAEFALLLESDSTAATVATATILTESLMSIIDSGVPLEKALADKPTLYNIARLALHDGPTGPVSQVEAALAHVIGQHYKCGPTRTCARALAAGVPRRSHWKDQIDGVYDAELMSLLPTGLQGVTATDLWTKALSVMFNALGYKVLTADCQDSRCHTYRVQAMDKLGEGQVFTGSGPTFVRGNVEALILNGNGGINTDVATAILGRIRKRPDLLMQEWDQLADESIELIKQNPLAP